MTVLRPGDVLEPDAFIKNSQNYIVSRSLNSATTTTQTFENINGASAQGIILEAIHNFRALPAPFDGLGINSNITIVNATANVIQGQGKSILPQSYPLTYNATETCNKYGVHFDLAESYTSRNLFGVGSGPSTNVYTAPIFRLDLNVAYDLNPHLQLFFQGKNLTNSVLEFTQSASKQFPIQREYYGQDFLVGVHYKL
jgi:outer membrane receptor protein involved in Fe transport